MRRRNLLKALGAASLPLNTYTTHAVKPPHYDVVVIGAGVFGVWTAEKLHKSGKSVALIDAIHPAHSAASSGGESRVTRAGYGDAGLYTEWSARSIFEWQQLSQRAALPLYHQSGVLWLHKNNDAYVSNSIRVLDRQKIKHQQFNATELKKRYSFLNAEQDEYGFFEPDAGALMARRAVQTLARELLGNGVNFIHSTVRPISVEAADNKALKQIQTADGKLLSADQFVFACGPWLDKVCPQAMAGRLFVTRQEVIYFAGGPTLKEFPVWADLPFYGIPSLEGRGFKVADDTHGEYVDPDTLNRSLSEQAELKAREFLAQRFPSMAEQPVLESRVCQYENTSNGDFVIDYHPGLENVILAGGGSGHGFKHGPAVGTHIAGLINGTDKLIDRFSLTSKQTRQKRAVQ